MIPPVARALKTPLSPAGANPLAACRLPVSKLDSASTRIVSKGMATFHHVIALLAVASWRTPR